MSLLPHSLFGAHRLDSGRRFSDDTAITTAIALSDRNALVFRAGATQAATRIGDVVQRDDGGEPRRTRRIMGAISNDTLKVTYGKPSGSEPTTGEEPELMITARDALALALQPGIGFRVIEAHPVYLDATSWYSREFGERPGVRMYAMVLLPDGVWITVDSVEPARTTQWIVRMFRNLAIVDGVMVILCFFAVRLVTRPLSVLASAAEDLGRNIDRPPLPERGANELVRASRALNVMQDRLKRYVDTRVKVLAAMSHDLKTPITRMRLRAEMLDDEQIKAKFIKDLDELQQMVGSTLDYMRGLAEGAEAVQPIDVKALISSLKEDAEEAGHTITVSRRRAQSGHGPGAGAQALPAESYRQCACLWPARDITLRDEGGALHIAVSDDGPGIPEDDIERVFEPFYRVEGSRNREYRRQRPGVVDRAQHRAGARRLGAFAQPCARRSGGDPADSAQRLAHRH